MQKDEEEDSFVKVAHNPIQANSWMIKEEPSSGHQSTFEIATQDSAQQEEQHSYPITAVYSEELTQINPSNLRGDKRANRKIKVMARGRRRGIKMKRLPRKQRGRDREYYTNKFRPIACSTPNWQAPILSIIEAQMTQSIPKTIPTQLDDDSVDLVFGNVIDSQDRHRKETQTQEKTVLVQKETSKDDDDNNYLREYQEVTMPWSGDGVGLSPHIGDLIRNEKTIVEVTPSNSQELPEIEDFTDNLSVDIFNLIPHLMVTSYSNTSKDILFGDPQYAQSQAFNQNYEAKRKIFISRIEEIIFETVSSLCSKDSIDPSVMGYKRCSSQRVTRLVTEK